MCHRVVPLSLDEVQYLLDGLHDNGHARLPEHDALTQPPDAYPGKQLAIIVRDARGQLVPTELIWGFPMQGNAPRKLAFNTRLDTALSHARRGYGMWAEPLAHGRCLVPVRAFFESWTKNPARRSTQIRFSFPGRPAFLLAGVCTNERVSLVTTEPNQSVGAWHTRMPLALGPGESSVWLGPDFHTLADRGHIVLDARV